MYGVEVQQLHGLKMNSNLEKGQLVIQMEKHIIYQEILYMMTGIKDLLHNNYVVAE